MSAHNLCNGQRAAIHGLLILGLSTTKISWVLGVSPHIVRRHVAPDWMPRSAWRHEKHPKRPRKNLRHAEVIAFHDNGKRTMQEVGDRFGVTREYIRQVLARHGIATRRGGGMDKATHNDRLQRYYAALQPGVASHAACAAAGLTYAEVSAAADALGVKLPKPIRRERLRFREIADYYLANPTLTGNDVAKHFSVNPNTVSTALVKMGVHSRQSGWKRKRTAAQQVVTS
jgi:hypothetical protein